MDLLGWRVSLGEKRLPFVEKFVSLGVLFDFSALNWGQLALDKKPGRVQKIKELIWSTLARRRLDLKMALSIHGKVSFAEGQTHGKVMAPLCRLLSRWASSPGERWISAEMSFALQAASGVLDTAKPRKIGRPSHSKPVLVFTDGACENITSVGGMIFDPEDGTVECYGAVVSPAFVDTWKSTAEQTQVIGQAEIFPVLVAKLTWQRRLAGRKAIYFIDNEAARLGLIKAYSPVLSSLKIIMQCLAFDFEHDALSWYARVPTAANLSDEPSRMLCKVAVGTFGATVVRPIGPEEATWGEVLESGL
jgi:hypothetical protein